jgi:ERCC4-type nuclease
MTDTILIDNKEKEKLVFENQNTEQVALRFGDYSIKGFEKDIAIERKSINDIASSLSGEERLKFERRIQDCLNNLKFYAVVIECDYNAFNNKSNWYSKITPNCLKGTIIKWMVKHGVHIVFSGSRQNSSEIIKSMFDGYLMYHKKKT